MITEGVSAEQVTIQVPEAALGPDPRLTFTVKETKEGPYLEETGLRGEVREIGRASCRERVYGTV